MVFRSSTFAISVAMVATPMVSNCMAAPPMSFFAAFMRRAERRRAGTARRRARFTVFFAALRRAVLYAMGLFVSVHIEE